MVQLIKSIMCGALFWGIIGVGHAGIVQNTGRVIVKNNSNEVINHMIVSVYDNTSGNFRAVHMNFNPALKTGETGTIDKVIFFVPRDAKNPNYEDVIYSTISIGVSDCTKQPSIQNKNNIFYTITHDGDCQ